MGVAPGSCCDLASCSGAGWFAIMGMGGAGWFAIMAGAGWFAIMGKYGVWSGDAWLYGAPIWGCEDSEEGQDDLGPGGEA